MTASRPDPVRASEPFAPHRTDAAAPDGRPGATTARPSDDIAAQLAQRTYELELLRDVQEALALRLPVAEIYSLVGDRIRDLFDAQVVSIATFDHEAGLEHFHYAIEKGQKTYDPPRPIDPLRRRLIDTRKPILVNDRLVEALVEMGFSRPGPVPGTEMPQSALFVPLVVGDAVRGYVTLQNVDHEHAFSDADLRLLSTLASSMSVALENARLFDETNRLLAETARRAVELDTVNTISSALVSQLDVDTLVHLVGEKMRETFDADIVYVALLDREANVIRFPYVYGETLTALAYGEGITSRIITTNEPLLINTDMSRRTRELGIERIGRRAASYLGVPIVAGGEAGGVISVQSLQAEDAFDQDDLRLLSTIASNVGIALHNAQAYQQLSDAIGDLKRAQAQLVQQEKLASLGALTAGIAHEIKNPLNFVNNFGRLTSELAEELLDVLSAHPAALAAAEETLADLRTNAGKIEAHGKRADAIVRSMLLHSRGGAGAREKVDLNALVEEYVSLAYHGRRAQHPGFSVEVVRDYDAAAGDVEVVAQDIGRVVLNLISNAFDAAADHDGGGQVPRVCEATRRRDDGIAISVRDNGPGVPPAMQDRIFEPFFTTKTAGRGTGLGLSLSHEIVTAGHGGSMTLKSDPAHGTEFTVFLPVS